MPAYQIGFIIEQALGHITHGQNLQQNLADHPDLAARWALPAWQTAGLGARIPIVKSNWTVQAGLQARRAIAQWQRSQPVDGLFFHTQVPAVLCQDWLRKIPSVVSLDATPRQYDRLGEHYEHPTGPDWLERRKWALNVSCYRAARHLVTWSQWAKQGLVDEYEVPIDKITVIPPGVNSRAWQRPSPRRPSAQEPVKILFVGGSLERKGGHVLLEAFRRLRAAFAQSVPAAGDPPAPAVELHLVTRTPVTAEPGVRVYNQMEPNSPALKKLFHDSDIFCLPSFGDCLPMALAEAGAAGLPLVATDVAAIPEIVRHEETGLVVPPQNVDALQEALTRLVLNPDCWRAYGQQAEALVQAAHDAPTNAARLLAILKQTVDEPRKRDE